jgi:hypothetical protein
MKKLIFIAVFGLGGLTASAQVTEPTDRTTDPTQQTTDPAQQTTDPTQQTTDPTQQNVDPTQQKRTAEPAQRPTSNPDRQTAERATTAQDGYNEIGMKEMPGSLKKSVKKDYPNAKVNKAYKNKKGQYKLDVGMEDGTSETMYMDKDGKPMDNR